MNSAGSLLHCGGLCPLWKTVMRSSLQKHLPTQQFLFWACVQRKWKGDLREMSLFPCAQRHASQEPRS